MGRRMAYRMMLYGQTTTPNTDIDKARAHTLSISEAVGDAHTWDKPGPRYRADNWLYRIKYKYLKNSYIPDIFDNQLLPLFFP